MAIAEILRPTSLSQDIHINVKSAIKASEGHKFIKGARKREAREREDRENIQLHKDNISGKKSFFYWKEISAYEKMYN